MLEVCIILQSEKAETRCLNEKMKDCYLNQTSEEEALTLDNTCLLLFRFLDYATHH